MKMPRKPPPLSKLFESKESMVKVLDFTMKGGDDLKYRHWDDLKHLTPPKELTSEEWWWALKLKRQSNRNEIPLTDTNHQKFSFSVTDLIFTLLNEIDILRGGELFENRQTQNDFFVRSLIKEAITSSQLEGASTTRVVAKEMLRSKRPPRDKDERMIYNNYLAMEKMRELAEEPLSMKIILELHQIVTQNTLEDPLSAGRFRRSNERVVIEDPTTGEVLHSPPPACELENRINALCEFANEQNVLHPILRAILIHFWLSYDHPFVDGNGRTARILFYWALLQCKYELFEFISISEFLLKAPAQYAKAFLHTETDDNDLNYFIIHQLKTIRQSLNSLYKHIQIKARENRTFETKLKNTNLFNYRQEKLIIHALKHPHTKYTIQAHKNSHRVAYDTARNDLLDLEKKGFLLKKKEGNAFVFYPTSELLHRVEQKRM